MVKFEKGDTVEFSGAEPGVEEDFYNQYPKLKGVTVFEINELGGGGEDMIYYLVEAPNWHFLEHELNRADGPW